MGTKTMIRMPVVSRMLSIVYQTDRARTEGPVPMVSVRSQRTTATVVALQPSPRRGHAGAGSAQGYPHRDTPGRISREPEDEVSPAPPSSISIHTSIG